jgi:hypothetical protein
MPEKVNVLLVCDGPVAPAAIEAELAKAWVPCVISHALTEPQMLAAERCCDSHSQRRRRGGR